jgi:hypothetical protein
VRAEQIMFEPEIAALAGAPRRPVATRQPVITAHHPDARPISSLEVLQ